MVASGNFRLYFNSNIEFRFVGVCRVVWAAILAPQLEYFLPFPGATRRLVRFSGKPVLALEN